MNENLAGLVVLAGSAFGLLAAFQLIELLLTQAIIASPIVGPLCVVVASVRGRGPDRDPSEPDRNYSQGSGSDGCPIPRVEHKQILGVPGLVQRSYSFTTSLLPARADVG